MQKVFIYFSIIILMLFSACTQQVQSQNTTVPVDDSSDAEVKLPIQVTQANKANFSAINHPMQLENPLWKGGIYRTIIKYKLVHEPGMDEYRLNITLKAVSEAIAELEGLTNNSLEFQESNFGYGLLIEINSSLKHIDPNALGISSIQEYVKIENYNEVRKAWIALTPTYPCAAKIEAMHELLHVLGFGHSNETNSIMYTYGAVCTSKVANSVKQTLNALYP